MNRFNNPFANQQDQAFEIGQALGNIGNAASTNFGKSDGTFGGVDISKGTGDTDLAKFSSLTENGTDFSKLGITDPKKIEELTQLYTKANL